MPKKSTKSRGRKTKEVVTEDSDHSTHEQEVASDTEEYAVDKSWSGDKPAEDTDKVEPVVPKDSVANFDYDEALKLGSTPIQDLDLGQRLQYMIAKSKVDLNPAVRFTLIKLYRQLNGEKLHTDRRQWHGRREGNRFGGRRRDTKSSPAE